MRIRVQCTLSSCAGIMHVMLWENSVRFITSPKRRGNVCVCVWGGGGGGRILAPWTWRIPKDSAKYSRFS